MPGPALADGGFQPVFQPNMFFVGFSEILRRWKAEGKLFLLAFARVLGIYFPTVSAWY